jgi:hypothetical protein
MDGDQHEHHVSRKGRKIPESNTMNAIASLYTRMQWRKYFFPLHCREITVALKTPQKIQAKMATKLLLHVQI